jgi:hypothetical protein
MTNVNDLLRDHVTLTVECLDRIYLNGYIPTMQMPGQLVNFLLVHRGNKVPSPALLGRISDDFVARVKAFAEQGAIPIVHFEPGQRKDDIAAEYRPRFAKPEGVVFIGVAQEKAQAFKARKKEQSGYVGFEYSRDSVRVNHYYFYIQDADCGPLFIKVCSYAPYGIKVCLNGHEWAKQQLRQAGIAFEVLDNGFLSCADPQRLQTICDQLGPDQMQALFAKWIERLPMPLTAADRQAGYAHRLSVWQLEVSRTQVFADPVRGREFFEAVIRENLDLGRPDRVQLVFDRKIIKSTPGQFRTRVIEDGVQPSLHIEYKTSRVKQYFKEGRALRTETTINDPKDFGVNKDLSQLPYLAQIGRQINRRLLDVQRVSHNCHLSQENVERVVLPTVTEDGQRASGLRFGQLRVMALLAALTSFLAATQGFTHRSLRPLVADLQGLAHDQYTTGQLTYDLRRPRLKGIIWRVPNSQRYLLTPYGRKVALFFTRLHARVFQPGFAALDPAGPIPSALAEALSQVEREIDRLIDEAGLAAVPPNLDSFVKHSLYEGT